MAYLYLIRHGQTDMNIHHMLQGRTDTHLNEKGIRQAEMAGTFIRNNNIKPDVIMTSPLIRTIETAEHVTGLGRECFKKERLLIEMSFGEYEGKEVGLIDPVFEHDFFHDPAHVKMPEGAESFEHLLLRAEKFMDNMYNEFGHGDERTAFAFGHGAIIHAILAVIKNKELKDFWSEPVHNAAVIKVSFEDRFKYKAATVFEGFPSGNM